IKSYRKQLLLVNAAKGGSTSYRIISGCSVSQPQDHLRPQLHSETPTGSVSFLHYLHFCITFKWKQASLLVPN
uniref:Uncharacterized protein n=1 Tax=Haplochromis burtoni TaxID=8153 RepID=A0A3Q3CS34_HAPBU